jgi:hypothetical protein
VNKERRVGIDKGESERSGKETSFKTKRRGKARKRIERNGRMK